MQQRVSLVAIAAVLATTNAAADGDMWGCECLLCLSNPSGPTAVSQCVPPITKLWDHLKKGRAFPECSTASGDATGRSYAKLTNDFFEQCPTGFTLVDAGEPPGRGGRDAGDDRGRPRLCGDKVAGTHTVCDRGEGGCYALPVYSTLYALSNYQYSGAIDVYISEQFYTRVHWQDNAWSRGVSDEVKQSRQGVVVAPGTCVGTAACAAGGTLAVW